MSSCILLLMAAARHARQSVNALIARIDNIISMLFRLLWDVFFDKVFGIHVYIVLFARAENKEGHKHVT